MIGRVTHGMTTRGILADMSSAALRLASTQSKLSSGKQLTKPSDDPVSVGHALRLRADLAQNRQHQRNVGEATAWQSVTDTAMANIGELVVRARELIVAGGNDAIGSRGRQAIASELSQVIDAIKSEANTQHAGRYVFAGSATGTKPYTTGASDAYAGNTAVVTREIGPGVQIELNTVGSSIIGDGSTGLLKTLRDAVTHLQANDGASIRGTDLAALDTAHDQLLNVRAIVGARQQRLEIAAERLSDLEQVSTTLLSNVEDADMAETLVHFSTQQAVYQAALKAGAQVIQPSLMDFLR